MLERTILSQVITSVKSRPVTLITGARQVGKATLASLFVKEYGFNYISLDNSRDRELAKKDPIMFLSLHPWPLIIDEVQRAPELFEALEEVVNKEKMTNGHNYGMYILTSSQMYQLMNNVTQSMAGRVSIIHVLPLSRSEIIEVENKPFSFDLKRIQQKALQHPFPPLDLFEIIVKGCYPELYSNPVLHPEKFYSDYVETYLERDVSELLNVKDKYAFRNFMELIASLTGEELIYDNIAKIIGVDIKTIKSWISVLLAGDIIYLLEPYNEISMVKRIVKRPKLYFNDTGLACYLARLSSSEILRNSAFSGRFVETYIINEIRKSYYNNGLSSSFYYYRDTKNNEIDLIILYNGTLSMVECKSGMSYNMGSVKAFKELEGTRYHIGTSGIVCNTDVVYVLGENLYALPIAGI